MGFPSPADDYLEMGLDWNAHLIQHPAATFPVRVVGKAMEPLIQENAYVVVDKSLEPKNNDIIVAIFREEFTIRRYVKNTQGISLIPENTNFPTIQIKQGDEFQVWGVVTFSVTAHKIV